MRGVDAVAEEYVDALGAAFPVAATALGRHDHDDLLGVHDAPTFEAHARRLRALRERLRPYLDDPDPETRLDARALDGLFATALLRVEEEQGWRHNPEMAIDTALGGCFALLLREFADLDDRLDSLRGRLDALPEYLDGARRTWSEVPLLWAEVAADRAEFGADFLRDDLPAALNGSSRRGAILDAAARAAEALRTTSRHLRGTGDEDATWVAGEVALAAHLRYEHHLVTTPSDLEARGLALVDEALVALRDIDPGWRATLGRLKDDHPPAAGLIDSYRAEMERVRRFVADRGLTPPNDAPLEVRPTPRFWIPVLPTAAYDPPGYFEPDQRGIFWVTIPGGDDAEEQLRSHFRASISGTCAHEGYPGHHQQLTHANRAAGLLRSVVDSTLTIEGWAHYCEVVLGEAGYFEGDPALRLCQLSDQLWRAARVVLDMRLHSGAATVEEAVDYLVRVAGLPRGHAVAEVRRYTSTPAYQICYAIGKAEILALRDRVREREGPAFDLGRFHTRLLDYGSVPVPLSAEAMLA